MMKRKDSGFPGQNPPVKKKKQTLDLNSHFNHSVVKIDTEKFVADYETPWKGSTAIEGGGTGFVIDKSRGLILTNAHVADPRCIVNLRLAGDNQHYPARVIVTDHDCDLSLLQVDHPNFRQACKAVPLGSFQPLGKPIHVIGFPVTGQELAATSGTTSSNELRPYYIGDGLNLTTMVTAHMNPGNSGGPVCDPEGNVVGIAFQGMDPSQVEGAGFMIPMPVIQQFLVGAYKSLESGVPSVGVPEFPVHVQTMQEPAARELYKMRPNHTGLRVCKIPPLAEVGGLKENDILLTIDGIKIGDDGKIASYPQISERLDFTYHIMQKQLHESVYFTVLRNGQEVNLTVPLHHRAEALKLLGRREFVKEPCFYIKNSLCFTVANQSFSFSESGVELQYMWDPHEGMQSDFYKTSFDEQLIAMSHVFKSELTARFTNAETIMLVDSINDRPIKNMKDLVVALETNNNMIINIKLKAHGVQRTVFKATPEQELAILEAYGIKKTHSDDLIPVIAQAKNPPAPVALPMMVNISNPAVSKNTLSSSSNQSLKPIFAVKNK